MNTPRTVGADPVGATRFSAARVCGVILLAGYVAVRAILETRYRLFDPDEALEMLAAGSLGEGKLPYLGALSHRGPFLTVLYAVPCTLFGPDAYRAVHAYSVLLFVLIGAWFQRCVARVTTERIALMALANLLLLATFRVPTEDNWSLNSDFLMAGWATLAMCRLLDARGRTALHASRPARAAYAGVGVCLALSFLTKQSSAPYWLVPIAYVALVDRQRALTKLGWLALGSAAPLALVAATYLASGELRRAWYFFYEYNRDYAAAAVTAGPLTTIGRDALWFVRSYGELLALAGAGALVVTKSGRSRHRATWILAGAWALTGLLAAMLPGKHWDNYLWASHAPVALLGALGGENLLHLVESRLAFTRFCRMLAAGIVAIPWLGSFAQTRNARAVLSAATDVGGIPAPIVPRRELVELVDRLVRDNETIYVTGYAPEMYVLAGRRPASRHVISNFVETVYPGRFEGPSRLVPRFFQELREDLELNRPRVILDACALGFVCHPSSALTAALPIFLHDYHPLPQGPRGVFVRND